MRKRKSTAELLNLFTLHFICIQNCDHLQHCSGFTLDIRTGGEPP